MPGTSARRSGAWLVGFAAAQAAATFASFRLAAHPDAPNAEIAFFAAALALAVLSLACALTVELSAPGREAAALALVVAASTALITARLVRYGVLFGSDTGYELETVYALLRDGQLPPALSDGGNPMYSFPGVAIAVCAARFLIGSADPIASLHLVILLSSAAIPLLTYTLCRDFATARTRILAAWVVAFSAGQINYGWFMTRENLAIVLLLSVLACLVPASRWDRRARWALTVPATIALSMTHYTIGYVLIFAIACLLVLRSRGLVEKDAELPTLSLLAIPMIASAYSLSVSEFVLSKQAYLVFLKLTGGIHAPDVVWNPAGGAATLASRLAPLRWGGYALLAVGTVVMWNGRGTRRVIAAIAAAFFACALLLYAGLSRVVQIFPDRILRYVFLFAGAAVALGAFAGARTLGGGRQGREALITGITLALFVATPICASAASMMTFGEHPGERVGLASASAITLVEVRAIREVAERRPAGTPIAAEFLPAHAFVGYAGLRQSEVRVLHEDDLREGERNETRLVVLPRDFVQRGRVSSTIPNRAVYTAEFASDDVRRYLGPRPVVLDAGFFVVVLDEAPYVVPEPLPSARTGAEP